MKLKHISLSAVILALVYSQNILAESQLTYKNLRGSILKLHFGEHNMLTGTFTTAVASKECQQVIGVKRPITGYIVKNALAFSVSYPECGSVVSIIGNMQSNNKKIDTTAIIQHQANNVATEGPGNRMIMHDTFSQLTS